MWSAPRSRASSRRRRTTSPRASAPRSNWSGSRSAAPTGCARASPPKLLTTDATALVKRGDLDVVIEVIGGIEPVRTLITTAFEHGASVVSANKALLAADGANLHARAVEHGVDLYYEAAVGAIPLIRPLRESLKPATRSTGCLAS